MYLRMHSETPDPEVRPLAVVTEASRGVGRELAKQLADHEFDMIVAAEDDELDATVTEVEERGTTVQGFVVDLATTDGVDELCAAIKADGRAVEAMCLTTGPGLGDADSGDSLDHSLRHLKVDVASTVHLSRCVLDGMVAEGRGRVLYTSLGTAVAGSQQTLGHVSSTFVRSFAEGLRRELVDTGVTVTSLLAEEAERGDPATIAERGFQAMMAGREDVVTGTLSSGSRPASDSPGWPARRPGWTPRSRPWPASGSPTPRG